MLIYLLTHQFKLLAQYPLQLPPKHLPLPCNNGSRLVAAVVVAGVAVAVPVEEEVVPPADNLLLHLQMGQGD
jgi:hypothetical protein